MPKSSPNFEKLWTDLKADLEYEATHNDLDMDEHNGRIFVTDSAIRAQEILDRMNQAEILANC